ncbi:MAG: DUF1294 domain-containing protein [Clostridia bacterium]|nr:DUF1294 domain-containing protein [Clostridia bacterium]
MIGDDIFSSALDTVFGAIAKVLELGINGLASAIFSNSVITIILFLIFINGLAILLMKKDKKYAETPDARRIRESTLLLVAIVGGGVGEYYAMYKYKHKTLHKKFLYGVPIAILVHTSMLAYLLMIGIMA